MDSIIGCKVKKELSHWEPLISEWHKSIERYCSLTDDAPYWFNERANISVLAGAAWSSGLIALEEFRHEKSKSGGHNDLSNTGEKWMGRCDLWLSSKDKEEIIEAKFKWASLRSKSFKNLIEKKVSQAVDDAKSSRGREDILSTGVLFMPVYLKRKYEQNIDSLIEQSIEEMLKLDLDCIAWCFPAKTRKLLNNKETDIYAGVFLCAKSVK